MSAQFRALVEGTFTRVIAGDESLIEVIKANAASEAPIHQAYRQAMAQEPVAPVLEEICSIRKREREDIIFNLDVEERKQRLEERGRQSEIHFQESKQRLEEGKQRLEDSRVQSASQALTVLDSFSEKKNVNDRTKMQFEDHIKNIILSSQSVVTKTTTTSTSSVVTTNEQQRQQPVTVTTTTAEIVVNDTAGLTVSLLAKDMGFKVTDNEAKQIGKSMAKRYREKYGEEPTKHLQAVNGATIRVNSYIQRDKSLMQEAIHEIVGKKTKGPGQTHTSGLAAAATTGKGGKNVSQPQANDPMAQAAAAYANCNWSEEDEED